jgi:hypothetical protein
MSVLARYAANHHLDVCGPRRLRRSCHRRPFPLAFQRFLLLISSDLMARQDVSHAKTNNQLTGVSLILATSSARLAPTCPSTDSADSHSLFRTTHRNPTWLVDVSIASAWRAAGR